MTEAQQVNRLMKLCDEVQRVDDQLGRYSDYEGTEVGPTFHLWKNGKASFESACERAVRDHRAAISIWRKLQRLNRSRD